VPVILQGLLHSPNVLERVITGFENGVDVLWFKPMTNSSHAVLVPPTYTVMAPTGGQYKAANRLHSTESDFADT
jgi:hypothetical protein